MKKCCCVMILLLACSGFIHAQVTFPVNGIPDERNVNYAFTGITLWVDYKTKIDSATLLIKDGKVLEAGKNVAIPQGTVVFSMKGTTVYPSFIDLWTGYGLPEISVSDKKPGPQIVSATKGAYGWNQAIKPETSASELFNVNGDDAAKYRKAGFGNLLTHQADGIARGTAALVSLAENKEQEVIVKENAATCYSFKKGSSRQDYPTSQMGAIALLRQTFLDGAWYKAGGREKEYNISLDAWNRHSALPKIFESGDKLQALRADKIAKEFQSKFIIKGSGDEYQRLSEIKKTGTSFILPLKFPDANDVTDPYDAGNITLGELKHWEMAPANPYFFHNANIDFAFTSSGLKDPSEFLSQLRKAVKYGLPEEAALKACTHAPASMLGMEQQLGALRKGMRADFIICSGNIFNKDAVILENWVQGERYMIRKISGDVRGNYKMTAGARNDLQLRIGGEMHDLKATVIDRNDTLKAAITFVNHLISLRFDIRKIPGKGSWIMHGYQAGDGFRGMGQDSGSAEFSWEAIFHSPYTPEVKIDSVTDVPGIGGLLYPNKAFGFSELPGRKTVLIKNVTVWTNEETGILKNSDVLIADGKIKKVGSGLEAAGADVIDGTGMHLTAGIIDEHSHIAISGDVNECSHAVTAEVRTGDVIDCDDINIYRQLGGGVTTSQLLHGSCNPIGGQATLIKLRWGMGPEQMKFEGADGFIKFALGENVKQSNWGDDQKIRYPQTRMGVEQVFISAFTGAKEYMAKRKGGVLFRCDLRLETVAEILDKKRFITCHSYQQGEINMLMHVADSLGFKVNTFTHVLEGYKVADKIQRHGAGASSFSDWWAYKYEVIDAIPYNGALLHKSGVVTAFNSDDPEMARRLNQEAAKAVKYGGVSEEEALKFVTLNPAKLLHIDNRVGSIREGKDADVVLWTDHPLSVYATVSKTFIDGTCYYDVKRDAELQLYNKAERNRLIRKMAAEKTKAGSTDLKKPSFKIQKIHHCIDEE